MRKGVVVGAIVVALVLGAGIALAAEGAKVQAASGTVVAVTEGSKTIVVESRLEGNPWIIGGVATDETKFAGKAKSFKDVKQGDQVTIQWAVGENGAVLQSVTVR